MKKSSIVIIVIASVLVTLFTVAAAIQVYGFIRKRMGAAAGGEYRWTERELYGEWVEIGGSTGGESIRLSVKAGKMTLTGWESKPSGFRYSVPSDVSDKGRPKDEVRLILKDCDAFEGLIFHEERLEDETEIPILSATIFEYDGRGEIVLVEFVRAEDASLLPEGFRSHTCIIRNDSVPVSTYAEAPELIFLDEPAENSLRKGETFLARMPKNRYGGNCEEGDYAVGRFIIWLCTLELTDDGAVVNESRVAVPYIVSDNGNDENLSMLSGGNDGLNPYGDDICEITTDENGEIIDAVFVGIQR